MTDAQVEAVIAGQERRQARPAAAPASEAMGDPPRLVAGWDGVSLLKHRKRTAK